ncbi:MAG: DUF4091 domain-containing protein [Verrucomicrobiales bacterium]|nr:DUF4091 domain-containing protein [Verrucomicrobiales bacterium]
MKFAIAAGCSFLAVICQFCPAADPAKNLIANPGFENGSGVTPESWRFSSWKESTGKQDNSQSFSGGKSALITGQNGGWATSFPVETGAEHKVSFRYRMEAGPAKVVLYIRDLNTTDETKKVIVYSSQKAIAAHETSGFSHGEFIDGADEKGWVLFDGGVFSAADRSGNLHFMIKLVSDNPEAKLWLDDVVVAPVAKVDLPPTSAVLQDRPEATVWWEDENRKVLPSDPPPVDRSIKAVELDLAGGEWGSFQIPVTPKKEITAANWSWGSFKGTANLPAPRLRCRLLETIPITETSGPLGETGPTPDPLTNQLPCDLQTGQTRSFWFTIQIPRQQKPGIYHNTLVFTAGEATICRIPLSIQVRGFSLPQTPTLNVWSGFRSGLVRQRESGDPDATMFRYYDSYFEHRTRCAVAARIVTKIADGKVTVVADRYVEHRKYIHQKFGPRSFHLPTLWISHHEHKMPPDAKWMGCRIFTDETFARLDPEFTQPFSSFLAQLCTRLQEEGLYTDPVVRFIDEPNLQDPATVIGIRTLAQWIRQQQPGLTIAVTAAEVHPGLTDVITEWVIHTDAWNRNRESIAAARKAGCRIAVYNNATNLVDYEPVRIRLWPWLLKKYEVDGSNSWWGTVCWRNGMDDPWTSGHGTSGVMLYPPRPVDGPGPVESVRWELFRQGLQDYEYLNLADQLATRLEEAGKIQQALPGREALENALALVHKWPRVRPANDRPYQRDVTQLRAARRKLADAIEQMIAEQ